MLDMFPKLEFTVNRIEATINRYNGDVEAMSKKISDLQELIIADQALIEGAKKRIGANRAAIEQLFQEKLKTLGKIDQLKELMEA